MLGTAQWGHAYGVTNVVGRLSDEEIASIAALAHEAGVTDVDTARAYGDAEQRLKPFASQFSVTTKISGAGDVSGHVLDSIANLGLDSVTAVLVHDWDELDSDRQTESALALRQLIDRGAVSRAGVSVYDVAGLEAAADVFDAANVPLRAVQVPANVLDRRFDESPVLADLAAAGSHVVARSAFLQGILLSLGGGRADHRDVARFRESLDGQTSPLEACLGHVRALPWATHVVVGATSTWEWSEILTAWESCTPALLDASLGSSDLDLIDPRRW